MTLIAYSFVTFTQDTLYSGYPSALSPRRRAKQATASFYKTPPGCRLAPQSSLPSRPLSLLLWPAAPRFRPASLAFACRSRRSSTVSPSADRVSLCSPSSPRSHLTPISFPVPISLLQLIPGTYYNGGGALGACGAPVNDQNAICALSPADFDASSPGGNPNANTLCGSCVTISYQGKTATCTVMDRWVWNESEGQPSQLLRGVDH